MTDDMPRQVRSGQEDLVSCGALHACMHELCCMPRFVMSSAKARIASGIMGLLWLPPPGIACMKNSSSITYELICIIAVMAINNFAHLFKAKRSWSDGFLLLIKTD